MDIKELVNSMDFINGIARSFKGTKFKFVLVKT